MAQFGYQINIQFGIVKVRWLISQQHNPSVLRRSQLISVCRCVSGRAHGHLLLKDRYRLVPQNLQKKSSVWQPPTEKDHFPRFSKKKEYAHYNRYWSEIIWKDEIVEHLNLSVKAQQWAIDAEKAYRENG